jgi:hypothetical protein
MGRWLLTPLLLFTLALGSLAALPVAADTSPYKDPNGTFSITQPDGWKAETDTALGTVQLTNSDLSVAFFVAWRPAKGASLADALQNWASTYAQNPEWKAGPDGVTDLTVGGQPAKAIVFTKDFGAGLSLTKRVMTVINQDTEYDITIGTDTDKLDATAADVTAILTSWQFTASATAPLAQASWQGTWKTAFGTMQLTQTDTDVTGTYESKDGKIVGKVSGGTLVGTWSQSPSYAPPADGGDFEFTLAADGQSFTGRYRYGSDGTWFSTWTGTRSG